MIEGVSYSLLYQLSDFIDTRIGLHFPKDRLEELERGISEAAKEFGYKNTESCIRWMISSHLSKDDVKILAKHLTISETYFLRDRKMFETIGGLIIPELIRSGKRPDRYIRIWCAGCSTGEEPYSMAMILLNMVTNIRDWKITILATDINPKVIQKAKDGIYTEWSFRDTPAWVRNYFRKKNGCFEIIEPLKKMVTFSYHNLAEDVFPSIDNNTNAMDIIICRNVMMYFSHDHARNIINNFYQCLVEGGYLVVGPVETSFIPSPPFVPVNFQDVTLFRKGKGEEMPGEMTEVTQKHFHVPVPPEPLHKTKVMQKPQGLFEQASLLYEQGKYTEAAETILLYSSQNPNDPKAVMLLARAYANMGKLAQAHDSIEKAIASDRLDPACYYLHAMIHQGLGQIDEAAKSLKQALYLDPDFVLAYFALGNIAKQQGKTGEFSKYFYNALKLLKNIPRDDILPYSDGITTGRLTEIIKSITEGHA